MKDIKSNEWSLFSFQDPQSVKFFYGHRLNFSHLNEHKFRPNFKEYLSPMSGYRLENESAQHFFLRCRHYHVERSELLNSLYKIDSPCVFIWFRWVS